MPHNPADPRVRKTRRGLQDAFIRLILRQGYDSISIQDIASEADTARVTFYRHYPDKEALLSDCLNRLYEELAARIEALSRERLMEGYSPVLIMYEHMAEQETLYRILFSSHGTQTVISRMQAHLAQHALARMQAFGKQPRGDIPVAIIAQHTASAQLGLAMWWLEQGQPYPIPYMARVSLWLTLSGLLTTFDISEVEPPLPLRT